MPAINIDGILLPFIGPNGPGGEKHWMTSRLRSLNPLLRPTTTFSSAKVVLAYEQEPAAKGRRALGDQPP